MQSSNIQSIGYDPDSLVLEVAFLSGGLYQYDGVPEYVFEELMSASSHGKYFAAHIKNVYPTRKIW
ncbi:MAG: KTSC domain-containing protein [Prevotella sp.]|nr:KTSC domain-containing protein [Prevotella sp.]